MEFVTIRVYFTVCLECTDIDLKNSNLVIRLIRRLLTVYDCLSNLLRWYFVIFHFSFEPATTKHQLMQPKVKAVISHSPIWVLMLND